jgi:hypothetical protein
VTLIAIVLAVALIVVVVGFLLFLKSLNDAWREERSELLERIQRPERVPPSVSRRRRPAADEESRPSDLPQLARIGTVVPLQDAEAGEEGA